MPVRSKTGTKEVWIETQVSPLSPSLDHTKHRFLARQPIFDFMGEAYGYELLFRSGQENRFTSDPDAATRTIVENWLLHGLEGWMGSFPFFLNCTAESLLKGSAILFPKTRTVLELLETVEPSDEIVRACRRLKRIGYGIALDDFQFKEDGASHRTGGLHKN